MILEITDDDISEFLDEYNSTNLNSPLDLDSTRKVAIKSWQDVKACPGSGKTTLIACKLIILAKKWNEKYRGICVLTHTNVACDEIKTRLSSSNWGSKLLNYPHFIGTIQEFVNKYLAFPFIRGRYPFNKFIESEEDDYFSVIKADLNCYSIRDICKNLYRQCNCADYNDIKRYLGSLTYENADFDLVFKSQNKLEHIKASSKAPRREMLAELKEAMLQQGNFQYRDMYCFAQMALNSNDDLKKVVNTRFQFVFIDEMQDTSLYQDNLINSIFVNSNIKLQRFGDHDQAIFDGMSGMPNSSFNNVNTQLILNSTHRFSQDIASKIHGLSVSQCGEISSFKEIEAYRKHTFFVFDENSKNKVLEKFAELVQSENPDSKWKIVKAVGAIEGVKGYISSYWSAFSKDNSNKSRAPTKLIDAVRQARHLIAFENNDVSKSFQLILSCLVKHLHRCDIQNKNINGIYFTPPNLIGWLKRNESVNEFRELIHSWLFIEEIDERYWTNSIIKLTSLLGIKDPVFIEITQYCENSEMSTTENTVKGSNIFQSQCGVSIEVGTIHSVKGETHDATLVLETKYKSWCDVHMLLDKLTLEDNQNLLSFDLSKEQNSQKVKFSRQLFVATSRPRHLLCFAVHANNINDTQKEGLLKQGWNIDYI